MTVASRWADGPAMPSLSPAAQSAAPGAVRPDDHRPEQGVWMKPRPGRPTSDRRHNRADAVTRGRHRSP